MTYRFVANVVTSGLTSQMYWALYTNMIATSPSGPGWVSVGEGNGTVGGMGTTGLFSGPGDFTSTSWFVLERPDGGSQLLFYRNSDTNAMFWRYSKGALYTGGDGSTIPTATDNFYVGGQSGGGGGSYFSLIADDEPPYEWYAFSYSGSTNILNIAYIALNTYNPDDTDPYVLYSKQNTAFATSYYGATCRCWDPTGTTAGDVIFPDITAGAEGWPANPPYDVNGNPILFDGMYYTLASDPYTFWKGTSSFVRWADANLPEKTRVLGGKFVKVGYIYLPWDNTPLL